MEAQTKSECLTFIQGVYSRLQNNSQKSGTVLMKYTVTTTMRNIENGVPKLSSNSVMVTAVVNKFSMRVITKYMEVYKDSTASVSVIPSRKVIYLAAPITSTGTEQQDYGFMLAKRDSLFRTATVNRCTESKGENGSVVREIIISPSVTMQRELGISSIGFTINPRTEAFKSINFEYLPASKVQSMHVLFQEMDLHYDDSPLSNTVMALFFDANGKLLPKYNGYKLIDVRKTIKRSR